MAGGGVVVANATEALSELAEMLQAPVVVSMGGKGAIDDRSYLAQSMVTGKDLMDALAMPPGPAVGRLLAALLTQVLEEPALNTTPQLLALARRLELEIGRESP